MAHAAQAVPPGIAALAVGPFLKWAGGKGQIFPQLLPFFPKSFARYHEAFLGSGAVFFNLRRLRGEFPAVLMDTNEELVNCFQVVRDDIESLVPLLRDHEAAHGQRYYYSTRDAGTHGLSRAQRAARFIYLNKTCYNGLYRVNSAGKFNVPVGSYKKPRIFDYGDLQAVARALEGVSIKAADFSTILDGAGKGDFVYFDPPYYTENSGFTGYAVNASGAASFGADEHRRLFNVFEILRGRGCHVVVSNSDTDYIRRLYRKYRRHIVKARRFINCNGSGRHQVSELVISSE